MRNAVLEGGGSRGIESGLGALGKTGSARNFELVGEVDSNLSAVLRGRARFGKVSQADGRQRRKHIQSTSFCYQGLKASSSTKMLRDQEQTVLARAACSRQAHA